MTIFVPDTFIYLYTYLYAYFYKEHNQVDNSSSGEKIFICLKLDKIFIIKLSLPR